MGEAIAQNADTILMTGAVQSNFTRAAVAVARAAVIGSCVRRAASLQSPRFELVLERLGGLYASADQVTSDDIRV